MCLLFNSSSKKNKYENVPKKEILIINLEPPLRPSAEREMMERLEGYIYILPF